MKILFILAAYAVTLTVAVASIFLLGRAGWPVMPVFVAGLISTRLLGALRHLWDTGSRRKGYAPSHMRPSPPYLPNVLAPKVPMRLDMAHLDLVTHRKG